MVPSNITWGIDANNGQVDTHEMHVGDVLAEHDARDGDGPDDEDSVLPQLQVVHEATGHRLLDAVHGRLGFLTPRWFLCITIHGIIPNKFHNYTTSNVLLTSTFRWWIKRRTGVRVG